MSQDNKGADAGHTPPIVRQLRNLDPVSEPRTTRGIGAEAADIITELLRDGEDALDFLLEHFGGVSDPSNLALWSSEDAYVVYWNLFGALAKARGQ